MKVVCIVEMQGEIVIKRRHHSELQRTEPKELMSGEASGNSSGLVVGTPKDFMKY